MDQYIKILIINTTDIEIISQDSLKTFFNLPFKPEKIPPNPNMIFFFRIFICVLWVNTTKCPIYLFNNLLSSMKRSSLQFYL